VDYVSDSHLAILAANLRPCQLFSHIFPGLMYASACELCRKKRKRCEVVDGSTVCTGCLRLGINCVRTYERTRGRRVLVGEQRTDGSLDEPRETSQPSSNMFTPRHNDDSQGPDTAATSSQLRGAPQVTGPEVPPPPPAVSSTLIAGETSGAGTTEGRTPPGFGFSGPEDLYKALGGWFLAMIPGPEFVASRFGPTTRETQIEFLQVAKMRGGCYIANLAEPDNTSVVIPNGSALYPVCKSTPLYLRADNSVLLYIVPMRKFELDIEHLVKPLENCQHMRCFTSHSQYQNNSGLVYFFAHGPGFEIHWMETLEKARFPFNSLFEMMYTPV